MKQRNEKGRFIFTGGTEGYRRDKPCPDCGKMIMRMSSYCRSCSQKGERSVLFRDAKPKCPQCGTRKKGEGLCRECWRGENHFAFKKEKIVGYTALHDWVRRYLGKATVCVNGHTAKRFVWANISGEYKRELNDWHSLCNSCNMKDGIKIAERFKNGGS